MVEPHERVVLAQKAVVILEGRVLLVHKSPGDPVYGAQWELPGGRLEARETLDESLEREVMEETGYSVAPGVPVSCWEWWDDEERTRVIAIGRVSELRSLRSVDVVGWEGDHIDNCGFFDEGELAQLSLVASQQEAVRRGLSLYRSTHL